MTNFLRDYADVPAEFGCVWPSHGAATSRRHDENSKTGRITPCYYCLIL